ncbi:FG-GAP-like repeat-containing protein [Streptomyces sp. NPDC023838]|uniref:FG-GAP-like repeat-containing protein n=1 Tax=Streptomyces sp. NPDC023838 TaxID=3154325 RepID=UPI0033F5CBC1
MLSSVSRSVRRAVAYAAALAVVVALVIATRSALPDAADRTADTAAQRAGAADGAGQPPQRFPLFGRRTNGHLVDYEQNGAGGLKTGVDMGGGFGDMTALLQANVSANGAGNDLYYRMNGSLYFTAERDNDTQLIGPGWDMFTLLVSVGNMGGTADPDLVARDAGGALWLYQGQGGGKLESRIKIGNAGWNAMDRLVGRGDYTGDGKADLISRGTDGTLYLYPGTGKAVEGGTLGSRFIVGKGWDAYVLFASTGDSDGDGRTDLIASDKAGALWLFKGTGNASAPFAPRVQIGTAGWGGFDAIF